MADLVFLIVGLALACLYASQGLWRKKSRSGELQNLQRGFGIECIYLTLGGLVVLWGASNLSSTEQALQNGWNPFLMLIGYCSAYPLSYAKFCLLKRILK